MTVFEIIDLISKTASRNEKQAILERNKNNKTLQRVIRLAYDPMTVFYIKKIPEYTPVPIDVMGSSLDDALDKLSKLSDRTYTGHAGIEYLKEILQSLYTEDAILIERIIGKDLRAGFSESTANKIWKGLVPEWPVMLATPFDQKYVDKLEWPCVAQHKLDAMRVNAVIVDGQIQFRSRNGKILEIPGPINTELLIMANNLKENIVYDGEVWVCDEKDHTKPAVREISNGVLLKSQKGTLSKLEADTIRMTLWDRINYDDFIKGESKVKYGYRWNILIDDYKTLADSHLNNRIFLVKQHFVKNIDETQKIFQNYLEEGQEGIILKDLTSIWQDKRSKKQIKFKAENTADLICTGFFFGDKGKENEFRLGRLQFESSDGKIKTLIGTGFSDKQRDELTEENTLGTIWEVVYNSRITDKKTGQEALFLPRVICQRWDKVKADHSKDIK
jgi:hypothetical protein